MDQSSRKRAKGPVAPGTTCPRGAAIGVYATGPRDASARGAIPALDWPDWTDQVRYTVTRTWPAVRPGGDA